MTYNLLLIDDDEDIQLILGSVLTTVPQLRLQMAGTGKQALEYLNNEAFQGVILDHQLPDMTGDDILSHLQDPALDRKPRVVMLSARDDEKQRKIWLNAGAAAVFKKPFNPIELLANLRTVFEF